jgi:hypothetical protein
MKTSSEIRHANLLTLIEEAGSIQAVAERLGKDHAQISQLKTQAKHSKTGKPRLIGDDIARLIEERFELEIGWMDNPHKVGDQLQPEPRAPIGSAVWPFDIPQARLQVLCLDDWNYLNTTMKTLVETRERDSKAKRNGTNN